MIGERLDFNFIFLKQQFKASLEQYFIFNHAAEGYPACRIYFDLPKKISFLFPLFLGRSMETASWEEKLTQWLLFKRAICEGEDFKHGMRTVYVSDNHKLNNCQCLRSYKNIRQNFGFGCYFLGVFFNTRVYAFFSCKLSVMWWI